MSSDNKWIDYDEWKSHAEFTKERQQAWATKENIKKLVAIITSILKIRKWK